LVGSIIQLDGRKSYDPDGETVTHHWKFTQVPIGSEVEGAGFKDIRPNSTAVSFVPDKTGVYVVQLIVNDGELDSDPITCTVNIQISRVPCGENIIPDAHFLWSYISDFWKLVEDREKITSIWSSAIQVIGTDLMKIWGVNLNKSLDTIQPTFQRRWQSVSMRTDVSTALDQRIIAGKTDAGVGGETGPLGTVPGTGMTSVFRVRKGRVGDGDKTDFTNLGGNYGAKGRVVVVNGEAHTISRVANETLVVENLTGLSAVPSSNTIAKLLPLSGDQTDGETLAATARFDDANATFQTDGVTSSHILRILSGTYAGDYQILNAMLETALVLSGTVFPTAETGLSYVIIDPTGVDFGASQVGDKLTINDGDDAGDYLLKAIGSYDLTVAYPADPPGGPVPAFTGGSTVSITVGRDYSLIITDEEAMPEGVVGASWRIPHLLHVPGSGFEDAGVSPGDLVVFEVSRADLGLTTDVYGQVVGADRDRIGFEFSGAVLDPVVNSGSDATLVESGGLVTVSGLKNIRPTSVGGWLEILNGDNPGVYRIRGFLSEDAVTIENRLASGADSANPGIEWVERGKTGGNFDRALFRKIVLDLRIVPGQASNEDIAAAAETLISFMPTGINLNTRPFSQYGVTFKAKEIIHNQKARVPDELVSAPVLQESVIDPPVALRENLDYVIEDGMLTFVSDLFSISEPSPEKFWMECAIFDNSAVVEGNFGRLVGLLKDDLTESRTRAPYLSAVKGLFFAYTNGPTISNIRLGLQILLGLPFSEETGVVLEVQDSFTVDTEGNPLGRILIEDTDEVTGKRLGFRRVYFYSTAVGLETNPATQRPYAIGDKIVRFAPISKGVDVVDYVKDPLWWQRTFQGLEILKYFTFKVFIDSRTFNADDVQFAVDFVRQIKPAYTKVVTSTLLELVDDIELTDVLGGREVMKFYDNIWGLEATARSNDYNQQGGLLWNAGSAPFNTRTPRMLQDVVTSESTSQPRTSGTGGQAGALGNPSLFRMSGYITTMIPHPPRAGDTLRVLSGSYVGDYEILSVDILDTSDYTIVKVVGTPFTALQSGVSYEIVGTNILASSATGWDLDMVRGRQYGGESATLRPWSPIEGDILVILQGQEGSTPTQPGMYEIEEVIDENTLHLGWSAFGPDPDDYTYYTLPVTRMGTPKHHLVTKQFQFGSNLICTILRREAPTLYRGTDLVVADNVVSSAAADFVKASVRVGDHVVIEKDRANPTLPASQGEYVIVHRDSNLRGLNCTVNWTTGVVTGLTGMSPSMVGRTIVFDDFWAYAEQKSAIITSYVDPTSVEVRNDSGATATRSNERWHIAPLPPTLDPTSLVVRLADGTDPVFGTDSDLAYRIVRPVHLKQQVLAASFEYNSGITEQLLRAIYMDVVGLAMNWDWAPPVRDIFTPGMVGQFVSVSGHPDPTRNQTFYIKGYVDPGRIAIDAAFTETSNTPVTLTFGAQP